MGQRNGVGSGDSAAELLRLSDDGFQSKPPVKTRDRLPGECGGRAAPPPFPISRPIVIDAAGGDCWHGQSNAGEMQFRDERVLIAEG